jgi:hypothetical protein
VLIWPGGFVSVRAGQTVLSERDPGEDLGEAIVVRRALADRDDPMALELWTLIS